MATLASRITDLAGAIRDKLNLMNTALRPAMMNVVIDGGGATITTGIKLDVTVPFDCTIQGWTILGDQSGSIQFDIWKTSYANAPPNVGNTITASSKPIVSTAAKATSTVLTGWTTSITAGDVLRFNVDSITTMQRVTLALKLQRS